MTDSRTHEALCVFFTLTDRASAIPSNIRGCQSGPWSAGQEKIRGTSHLQSSNASIKTKTKTKNEKKKGTITGLDEFRFFFKRKAHARKRRAFDRESWVYRQPRAIRYPPPRIATININTSHLHPKAHHLHLRTLRVSGFPIGTIGAAWGAVLESVQSMRL